MMEDHLDITPTKSDDLTPGGFSVKRLCGFVHRVALWLLVFWGGPGGLWGGGPGWRAGVPAVRVNSF